jgi:hypothetical protein
MWPLMLTMLARMLLLRRFGGRGLIVLGVLNFLRRLLAGRRRQPPGVYEPGQAPRVYEPGQEPPLEATRRAYQPSQGSSQTTQRDPRY